MKNNHLLIKVATKNDIKMIKTMVPIADPTSISIELFLRNISFLFIKKEL